MVADFTYVPTWTGMVYVAFVINAFARRIIGWRAARSMTTSLVLDALEHAFFTRGQQGITDLTGLVSHSDAGSQYTSVAFTTRLIEAGVDPSVGSVGDAYDNALAETTVGSFKNELIWREGPWRDVDHVEIETLTWVDWFNTERPHEYLDDHHPSQSRGTALHSHQHTGSRRVTQETESPDTPGGVTLHLLEGRPAVRQPRVLDLTGTSAGVGSKTEGRYVTPPRSFAFAVDRHTERLAWVGQPFGE